MSRHALNDQVALQQECTESEVVKSASLQILQQLKLGLKELSPEQYTHIPDENTSSIGGHSRHIVEFYHALLKYFNGAKNDVLCYDK